MRNALDKDSKGQKVTSAGSETALKTCKNNQKLGSQKGTTLRVDTLPCDQQGCRKHLDSQSLHTC